MSESSESKLAVVAAVTMDGAKWQVGAPMPGREASTRIKQLHQVSESYVEIFASVGRWEGEPGKGNFAESDQMLHATLMPPTLMVLISIGPLADWTQVLQTYDPSVEQVEEIVDLLGKVWRMNYGVPGENEKHEIVYDDQLKVVKMLADGNRFEIFALPTVGTTFERQGLGLQWTLMPLTVQRSIANFPKSKFEALLEEIEGDEDEPELEPEPEPARPAASPQPAPAPQQPITAATQPSSSFIPDASVLSSNGQGGA